MLDSFQIKNPVYPIFTICASLLIFAGALLFARSIFGIVFLVSVFILLCCFGYWHTCLKIIPFLTFYTALFYAVFYFASKRNAVFAKEMAIRLAGLVIAFIPGISLPPANLVHCLTELKFPRLLTLGILVTLTFIPVLKHEINQIRNAMKTRGATSLWKPQVFYRAILIPLVVRIVNISDTLTLSVETRGFMCDDVEPSVYKPIHTTKRDIIFAIIFMLIFAGCLSFSLIFKNS